MGVRDHGWPHGTTERRRARAGRCVRSLSLARTHANITMQLRLASLSSEKRAEKESTLFKFTENQLSVCSKNRLKCCSEFAIHVRQLRGVHVADSGGRLASAGGDLRRQLAVASVQPARAARARRHRFNAARRWARYVRSELAHRAATRARPKCVPPSPSAARAFEQHSDGPSIRGVAPLFVGIGVCPQYA